MIIDCKLLPNKKKEKEKKESISVEKSVYAISQL